MKVAVITRHAVLNYGSFLQTYATQKIIEQLGYECEIIDYIRKDEHYSVIEKTLLRPKPQWNKSWVRKAVYLALRQPESFIAGKKFEEHRIKYLNLSKRYSSAQELKQDLPQTNCFMVGSDQVWGPVGAGVLDDCYFLSFVDKGGYKFSYASSFGRIDYSIDEENHMGDLLKRFNLRLVREDSAIDRLKKMGLEAEQVLDPTLLLDRDSWLSKAHEQNINKGKSGYILVYQLHKDSRLGQYAKELAKQKGKKLFRVSPTLHHITRPGRFVYCLDPFKFISVLSNAGYLITDSFHGTAFAINLNIPFVEILPNDGTGTRNMSILRMTGLTDRVLSDYNDYALADKKIDFEGVNIKLQKERSKSLQLLKEMLDTVN